MQDGDNHGNYVGSNGVDDIEYAYDHHHIWPLPCSLEPILVFSVES